MSRILRRFRLARPELPPILSGVRIPPPLLATSVAFFYLPGVAQVPWLNRLGHLRFCIAALIASPGG